MPATPTMSLAVEWGLDNAASDQIVNVWHFAKIGDADPWSSGELVSFINDAGNHWSDTVGLVLTGDLAPISVTARQVVEGDAFSVRLTPPEGTFLNTDSGEACNPWEGALVTYASTAAGRRGIGRTYQCGIRASFIDSSGTVTASFRNQLAGAFTSWFEAVADGGETVPAQAVVYSRKYDSLGTIVGVGVRPLVAIQRDRRAGSR